MKYNIDGIYYHVDLWGNGFPLILFHGFTGDSSTWIPFREMWGNHSRLVAIDIIGHGKTDAPVERERYEIMSVVDDIFLLMENLKIEKADMLGYSMGGRLALSFVNKYPTKVRKLVLESASPGLKTVEERKARVEQDHRLAQLIEEKGMESFVDYWENIPLFQSQKRLSEDVKKQIREQRLRNRPIGLINSLKGMGTGKQPSWWDKLHEVTNETLLLSGAFDEKFCLINEEMAKTIPNCHHEMINDAGHAIHVEQPELFGTIISEFLSK